MDERLRARLDGVHRDCHALCEAVVGRVLPFASNIAVFAQSEEEFEAFDHVRSLITVPDDDPKRKYFELVEPLRCLYEGVEVFYRYLYVRAPDPSPYGRFLGDVDFVLPEAEYRSFVGRVNAGEVEDAQRYDRQGWDMVEISRRATASVAYVTTAQMAERARMRFEA